MTQGRRLRDVGEHAWLTRVLPGLPSDARVVVGPGDDAAVLRPSRHPQVVTVDALVEGVHFRPGWASARRLGQRAFRVSVSDLAAMGALPRAVVLAVEAPARCTERDLTAFVRGVAVEAQSCGSVLVGGNLSAGPKFAASLTIMGEARGKVARRTGARSGDAIFVTGRVGGSAADVRALRAGRNIRWPLPPLRVAAGTALARVASAMIDLSDGLVQDLEHVCRASGVGARIDVESVPMAQRIHALPAGRARRLALYGGGDYELLVTVPRRRHAALARMTARLGCPLTRIGEIVKGDDVSLRMPSGELRPVERAGYDHFR